VLLGPILLALQTHTDPSSVFSLSSSTTVSGKSKRLLALSSSATATANSYLQIRCMSGRRDFTSCDTSYVIPASLNPRQRDTHAASFPTHILRICARDCSDRALSLGSVSIRSTSQSAQRVNPLRYSALQIGQNMAMARKSTTPVKGSAARRPSDVRLLQPGQPHFRKRQRRPPLSRQPPRHTKPSIPKTHARPHHHRDNTRSPPTATPTRSTSTTTAPPHRQQALLESQRSDGL